MPFASKRQWRWAWATSQPFARRWAHETSGYQGLPAAKDEVGVVPGAQLHGPGGLLATPGMGRVRVQQRRPGRKWGLRTKAANYSARAGETIAGNLKRGNDGKFTSGGASMPPKRSRRGGRRAAKPKKAPEQRASEREQARQQRLAANRQAVIDAMAQSDTGLAPNIAKAMLDFADGKTLDPAIAKGLAGAGLVEIGADGQPRLSAAGRGAASAMNRGDARSALDAISRGADQAARAAKPKGGGGGAGKKPKEPAPAKEPTPEQRARDAERTKRQAEVEQRRRQVTERQQRELTDLAQQFTAGNKLTSTQLQRLVVSGLAERRGAQIALTPAGQRQARRRPQRAATKAASGPGDYLVVEDPIESSTWHLHVKRGGRPDHGLMGSAWAALHGGFRGNVYQGPQKAEALAKLKRLYAAEKMELPSEKSLRRHRKWGIRTKAQTASERAMFAKMSAGSAGGGKHGGAPPLWAKGPDGKRTPQAGFQRDNPKDALFGPSYHARQQTLQTRARARDQAAAQARESREAFFQKQTPASATPASPKIVQQPRAAATTPTAPGMSKPERYQALEDASPRVKMPQAGWNAPSSDRQQGYLGSLAERARLNAQEGSPQRALADELIRLNKAGKLTKWEASQLIDAMQQPKPLSTLIRNARDGLRHGDKLDAPWRALMASPTFRADLIGHTLGEIAKEEGLPF